MKVIPGEEEVTADYILLAAGSEPSSLPIPGMDLPGVKNSTQMLEEECVPDRLVIIGGGVIGMEFATVYNDLGCQVTVLEAMDKIDLIFINQGLIHGGIPENCIYECIVFDLQFLLMHGAAMTQYMTKLTGCSILIQSHFTRCDKDLFAIAAQLFEAVEKKAPAYELNTVGALYLFLGIIFQKNYYTAYTKTTRRNLKEANHIKPVLEYIENHYMEKISLEKMSRIAGISPKYFCRYFKIFFHMTASDYLNYKRVEQACYELIPLPVRGLHEDV